MRKMIDKKKVGEELLKSRQQSGLTRKRLSEMTGVSQSVIQKYEDNMSRFSIHSFLSLCEALELNPYYAFDPEFWTELLQNISVERVFGDVPKTPEDYQDYLKQSSKFKNEILNFPSDEFLTNTFKEKYSINSFRNLINQAAKTIERKKLGLSTGESAYNPQYLSNDDKTLETDLSVQENHDPQNSVEYPAEMADLPDSCVNTAPRMYSTDEMLTANIRYLNEIGKEKLFNSLCDLLKDPENLLKKPIISDKEE